MLDTHSQLRLIGELQRHLLPRQTPQPPGWHVAVHFTAGSCLGGDYYDLVSLPDGRLLLMVADAGDNGAPSTALIAMTRVLLHSCPLSSGTDHLPFCPFQEPLIQPPHIFLGHLNRVLRENTLPGHHMTAFVGVLDPAEGNFHYSNACHPYPWWWQKRERRLEPLRDATGQALGMDARATYHHRRIVVEPGDLLVLYTDGLNAAFNACGEVFRRDTLDAAMCQAAARGGAEAVKHWVRTMLEGFGGHRQPPNDVTLVVVERLA